MRYLYADATPFPLTQNFLATLCAATDACVAILKADELVDACNQSHRDSEARAKRELEFVEELTNRLEHAFGGGPQTGFNEVTLGRVRGSAFSALEECRAEIAKQKEQRQQETEQLAPRARVLPALSSFLVAHELPETSWGIRWTQGTKKGGAKAELYARTSFGMEAQFDVAIPPTHLWARPASVALLGINASISMVEKPWVGRPRRRPVELGPLVVSHVVLTPERASLRLSKKGRAASTGLELVFGGASSSDVTATRLDKNGYPVGEAQKLEAADAQIAQRLWTRATTTLGQLVAHRVRAVSCKLGGVAIGEVARPEIVASAIIRTLAPYVREIANRTTTPGELSLKRETGDGCREELFVHYDTILDRMNVLLPAHRALFDMFGLGEDKTQETNLLPRSVASVWKLPQVKPPKIRAVS